MLIIELKLQFVVDLQIEEGCKIDLEFLPDPLADQIPTVLIIVQGFPLA